MKNLRISALVILPFLLLVTGAASATPSICTTVLSGSEMEFCGVVTAVSSAGEGGGITIKIEEALSIFVNGLGPISFWKQSGVARPKVGDQVCVVVMTVLAKNILMSLTYVEDGTSIEVRDPVTGCPLWWNGNNGKKKGNK